MNYNNEHIRQIERYVDGDMTAQETQAFEQQLATDPELNLLHKREQSIINGIRRYGMEKDVQFLRKLETSLSKEPSRSLLKPWHYAIAASLLLLVVSYWSLRNSQPDPAGLFEAYFKPYPGLSNAATRGTSDKSRRTVAVQLYESGQYESARTQLDLILAEESDPELLLLLGNTNLILGRLDEAKSNFTTLSDEFDVLDVQARWYLSLCYLKEGNVEKAREELRQLSATEISYAQKAKELLRKVE